MFMVNVENNHKVLWNREELAWWPKT